MTRRLLVLVALALVGVSSVTGVGSVSSVSADRNVSVAVAPDGEAYLGLEWGAVDNGNRELTVYNHLSTDDVTVTVDTDSKEAGPGSPARFTVGCGLQVTITADSPDAWIEATRSVDCPVSSTQMSNVTDTATSTPTPKTATASV
jgi:hypothetical protein